MDFNIAEKQLSRTTSRRRRNQRSGRKYYRSGDTVQWITKQIKD